MSLMSVSKQGCTSVEQTNKRSSQGYLSDSSIAQCQKKPCAIFSVLLHQRLVITQHRCLGSLSGLVRPVQVPVLPWSNPSKDHHFRKVSCSSSQEVQHKANVWMPSYKLLMLVRLLYYPGRCWPLQNCKMHKERKTVTYFLTFFACTEPCCDRSCIWEPSCLTTAKGREQGLQSCFLEALEQ